MTYRTLALGLFFLSSLLGHAQVGGDNVYEFLNLPSSARVSALGGAAIAVKDNDPNLGLDNPSLYNESMDKQLTLNYISYFADINYGFVSYTQHFDSLGTFNFGVKYVDYGEFTETDVNGNELGTFTAGDYAFIAGYGRALDSNFSVGGNLKVIYSSLYDYNSTGIGLDLSGTYYNPKNELTTALVVKNIGTQLTKYAGESGESLPLDIQLAVSKRLARVPLRLSLVAHRLNTWDLTYDNPNDETEDSPLLGDGEQQSENENGFAENLARHLIFNAEFLLSESFNFRVGYNYMRRRDLLVDEKLGTVGLSWGFGFRINKFHLSYGRAAYHQVGATNTFSVVTRLSDFGG